jgi:hypothetical protein
MSYVKDKGKSMVRNTRWPDIHIKRARREIFHTYGMKFAPMDALGAS